MKKYVDFRLVEKKLKTNVYVVIKRSKPKRLDKPIILHHRPEDTLGVVRWYVPWRQYCFFPDEETVWSRGCLQQIMDFIEKLMEERKK